MATASALPPATAGFVIAGTILSIMSISSSNAFKLFALIPGNSFLGQHYFWNILTGSLIETSVVKLGLQVAVLTFAGSKAEQTNNAMLTKRLAAAALFSCIGAGLAVSLFYHIAYMSLPGYEGKTEVLFTDSPVFGCGPLTAAFAVAAHQLLGDTPIVAGQEILTYSLFPLGVVLISAVSQEVFAASKDLAPTLISLLLAWAYLRFMHGYGGGAVGDTRDAFEFLSMVPAPLRVPLRPLIKLFSAIFMPLPPFSKATGDGFKALPAIAVVPAPGGSYGGSSIGIDMTLSGLSAGGSGTTSDPVAERRRERALRMLDQKLAKMRTSMRGGGASGGGSAVGLVTPATPNGPALIPMPPTPAQQQQHESSSSSNGGPYAGGGAQGNAM